MSRRWSTRPEPDTAAPVLIECHDEAPGDPEPVDRHADDARPTAAGPSGRPRVVPSWLVAVAVLLACSAGVAASLWWQHRSRVIEVTNLVQRDYPAGPDSSGCPNRSRCQTYASVGQRLNTLARQLFPDSTVLDSMSVSESRTGRTVRTSIVLRTDSGIVVSADAQCVPGAAAVPGRFGPLPSAGPAQADFVVAGEPGCSVAVAARIPRAVAVPVEELQRLAGDPTVQLQP
ncbi:MAG: hypothetical protein ABIQ09_11245 [Jatrophihabitantaceae bacterium]